MATSHSNGPRVRLVGMNLSGKFSGREIQGLGHQLLRLILLDKNVGLLFGQQINFSPRLPRNYHFVGANKAFLIYDKTQFRAGDARQYRHVIRDLQLRGKLPFHYLPEPNYMAVKMRTRHTVGKPLVEFIALSWLTDERMGKTRTLGAYKKIVNFAANLSVIEELPVLIGGTFRVSFEEAAQCLPDGFSCYGYHPDSPTREKRAANFFVCSSSLLQMEAIKPIVCAGIVPDDDAALLWHNPEDAFYFDPVHATLFTLSRLPNPEPEPEPEPELEQIPELEMETKAILEALYASQKAEEASAMAMEKSVDENEQPPQNVLLQSTEALYSGRSDNENERPVGPIRPERHYYRKSKFHNGMTSIQRYASAPELYDEELMKNNSTCYMS